MILQLLLQSFMLLAFFSEGLNKFSDLTFDEFAARYLMTSQNCSATSFNHIMSGNTPPDHKDWRMEGNYVTPVKNQVLSFCLVAAIEIA